MTLPLFYMPDLTDIASQRESGLRHLGDRIRLEGAEGHHAAKSMRLGVGDTLEVTDGKGLRVTAEIVEAGKDWLELHPLKLTEEEAPHPRVTIVQALTKGARDEMAVETCTELGAATFIPWQADRSIVRWDTARALKGEKKWRSVALAAAKQSRNVFVPEVRGMVTSKELVALIANSGNTLICYEDATAPIDQTQLTEDVMVVIGPEGGISNAEIEMFEAAGAASISLGCTVLRASSAGAVALATINALTGRLMCAK